VSVKVEG